MNINVFMFDDRIVEDSVIFGRQFLLSPDFGADTIKQISRVLGISTSQNKATQVEYILKSMNYSEEAKAVVIEHLVARGKEWMSIKTAKKISLPKCNDPKELLFNRGYEEWYGPVKLSHDPNAQWYIRPQFLQHWKKPENYDEPHEFVIRWLCMARICGKIISLHWRGFTHAEDLEEIGSNKRFASWEYVVTPLHWT